MASTSSSKHSSATAFPASGLMPKDPNGITEFLKENPGSDGKGVVVAIFDTGCDHNAPGLRITSDGKPKFIDFIDSTGSGDVDMSATVKTDSTTASIRGLTGRTLKLSPTWKNPSGVYHIGVKAAYDIFPKPLVRRLQEARRQAFEQRFKRDLTTLMAARDAAKADDNAAAPASSPAAAASSTSSADPVPSPSPVAPTTPNPASPTDGATAAGVLSYSTTSSPSSSSSTSCQPDPAVVARLAARGRKALDLEIEERQRLFKDFGKTEVGPVFDCVSWHDGNTWRAVIDAAESGDLSKQKDMAAYKEQYEFACFSEESQLNYSFNFYENGNILSIVVSAGSHGTHVAGIVGAFFEDEPSRSGIAPGCQMISVKIGDTALGTMETGAGLIRGVLAAIEAKVDLINMSYGEASSAPNAGRFTALAQEAVRKHGIIYVSSAGNAGPCLSTVGSPGANEEHLIGVGAFVTPDMCSPQYSLVKTMEGQGNNFTWSSRGPSADGAWGVSISAVGGAVAPVPNWCLSHSEQMNGTSMSSPLACGGMALLVSRLKEEGIKYTPYRIKAVIEETAVQVHDAHPWSLGAGLLHVNHAMKFLRATKDLTSLDLFYKLRLLGSEGKRGVYLRAVGAEKRLHSFNVSVVPEYPKWFHAGGADDNKAEDAEGEAEASAAAMSTTGPLAHAPRYTNGDRVNHLQYIKLKSSQPWASPAANLVLMHTGKNFQLIVDPTKLAPGAHFAQITGHLSSEKACSNDDTNAGVCTEGPVLFRFPVTVIIPEPEPSPSSTTPSSSTPSSAFSSLGATNANVNVNKAEPHTYVYEKVPLQQGFFTKYFAVPAAASFAQVRIVSRGNEARRTYIVHGVQIVPKVSTKETTMYHVAQLENGQEVTYLAPLYGGNVWELVVAPYWNSMWPCEVDVSVRFHGITVNGTSSPAASVALSDLTPMEPYNFQSPIRPSVLAPSGTLEHVHRPLVPAKSFLYPLADTRNIRPTGEVTYQLVLQYQYQVDFGTSITVHPAWLAGVLYEAEFESQLWRIYDEHKKILGTGDAWPDNVTVTANSKVTIQLCVRHINKDSLVKLKNMPVMVKAKLPSAVAVAASPSVSAVWNGDGKVGEVQIQPGDTYTAFLPPPHSSSLPKNVQVGDVLSGSLALVGKSSPALVQYPGGESKIGHVQLRYFVTNVPDKTAQHKDQAAPALGDAYAALSTASSTASSSSSSSSSSASAPESFDKEKELRDMYVTYLSSSSLPADKAAWALENIVPGLKAEYIASNMPNSITESAGLALYKAILTAAKTSTGAKKVSALAYATVVNAADELVNAVDENAIAAFFGFDNAGAEEKERKAKTEVRDAVRGALLDKAVALVAIASANMRAASGASENKDAVADDVKNVEEAIKAVKKWGTGDAGKALLAALSLWVEVAQAKDLVKVLQTLGKTDTDSSSSSSSTAGATGSAAFTAPVCFVLDDVIGILERLPSAPCTATAPVAPAHAATHTAARLRHIATIHVLRALGWKEFLDVYSRKATAAFPLEFEKFC